MFIVLFSERRETSAADRSGRAAELPVRADLPPKLVAGCLDPSSVCSRFWSSVPANSTYAWQRASQVLVVLLVCFFTSLFVFDYFY